MNQNLKKLVKWSLKEFSHLPWRSNRTLYGTLVSEIMLQQTTVSTVLNHFERFLKEYPTPKHVANATEEQLLISWKGLGYYRRARNLQKACSTICNEYAGEIPLDFDKLMSINGIGAYTANAILSIGANKKALALDANLERIISRLYGVKEEKGLKLQKAIHKKFENNELCQEIDSIGARNYNEALMDLGRNYCQARRVSCELCPLKTECFAFNNNCVLELPLVNEVKKESYELELLRIVLKEDDKFLVYKKGAKEWLSNQYEIPTFILSSADESLTQYPKLKGDFWGLPSIKTAITKYKITNRVLWVNREEFKKLGLDISKYEFGDKNLSTTSLKAIDL
jgi:A/G-specific adenine glycosylase